MRDFRDPKVMAQTLREAPRAKSVSLTHSESLEVIAKTSGQAFVGRAKTMRPIEYAMATDSLRDGGWRE